MTSPNYQQLPKDAGVPVLLTQNESAWIHTTNRPGVGEVTTMSGRISHSKPNFHEVPRGLRVGDRFRFWRDHVTARKGEEVVVTEIGALISFDPAPGSDRQYLFNLWPHEVLSVLERVP